MTEKKYKLTEEKIEICGRNLYRIKALIDFGDVKEGEKGGYIEREENLSQNGNAWVYGNACVYGDARVSGNAEVYGDAWVYGNARVSGNAEVSGNACVYGDARVSGNAEVYGDAWVYGNARVSGNTWMYGNARVSGNAEVYGNADLKHQTDLFWISKIGSENGTLTVYKTKNGIEVTRGCFKGSLQEFENAVENTHGDSKHGDMYRLVVQLIKLKFDVEGEK